jgi:hypothetical protein
MEVFMFRIELAASNAAKIEELIKSQDQEMSVIQVFKERLIDFLQLPVSDRVKFQLKIVQYKEYQQWLSPTKAEERVVFSIALPGIMRQPLTDAISQSGQTYSGFLRLVGAWIVDTIDNKEEDNEN